MPDGATHDRITLALTPVFGFVVFTSTTPILGFIAMCGMSAGSILFSPDLDHDSGADAYRLWGPLRKLWWPYQRIVPHRSFISHTPVVGTAFKTAYLLGLGAATAGIPFLFGILEPELLKTFYDHCKAHWQEISAALIGIETASTVHIVADWWNKG